jgi:hypothetical protein
LTVPLKGALLLAGERGRITVLDRPGLEARSCEHYQVVKTDSIACCITSKASAPNLSRCAEVAVRNIYVR